MIKYCSDRGLNTSIHTNATILTGELSHRLINSGLSVISFSFDGYTKDVYESIRVGANFEKALNNILQFLRIKRETNSKTPHTSVQIIDFSHEKLLISTKEKKNFIKLFDGLPLDRIYIKPVHNWAGNRDKREDSSTGRRRTVRPSRCNSPWYSLVFHWDGSVYPCCLDYMGKYPLGNIEQESWIELWNGPKMRQLRSEINTRTFHKCSHCNECDKLYERKFLGVSTENLFNEALFRIRWNLNFFKLEK
jgi:radical SAM protein with 4Fe4S-binding SPASM domain